MFVFITGPVRSGKSRFALAIAAQSGKEVVFVATARRDGEDAEWVRRIERHRTDRPADWRTIETSGESLDTLEKLFERSSTGELLLIDSLGTWLADRYRTFESAQDTHALEDTLSEECDRFASLLARARCDLVVVSEETGWGIVPEYPSGRIFRDVLGRFNQAVAARAERGYLVVCGRALELHTSLSVGDSHD